MHSWTLKRDHLRYYFADRQYTYATGEDIQLAFALQKRGVRVVLPKLGDQVPGTSGEAKLIRDNPKAFMRHPR